MAHPMPSHTGLIASPAQDTRWDRIDPAAHERLGNALRKASSAKKRGNTALAEEIAAAFGRRFPLLFRPLRVLPFAVLQGLFTGAGFAVAVAIAMPLLIMILQRFDWVPLAGQFISEVTEWLRQNAG